MNIFLANPRGFCAGVDRAINIVKNAIEIYGPPIYVYNEVVHNKYVVNSLKKIGSIFVKKICDVPEKSILIFSAHGVSKSILKEANKRKLIIFDATCPLVSKVHHEIKRASKLRSEVIIIGHKNHPEIIGTIGQYNNPNKKVFVIQSIEEICKLKIKDPNNLFYFTQTTLSVDDTNKIIFAIKKKYPYIIEPRKKDICYATENRQKSIKKIIKLVDIIFIIGSKNSSNSNRLFEIANKSGKKSYLIDTYKEIKKSWLNGVNNIGITAGASAPEILVQQVVNYLKIFYKNSVNIYQVDGDIEKTKFMIPKKLILKIK
ncbi:lytB [Wigglesworthia glossinidia endosymbiont of Glossina brevipalpis]|uniref:4-hydroxy-3-methylbut-2-enyl diphosphate reductase n=1 Tax=Wigglesworthia glossinidia brevipalpis TaxID=36870 RepID=ISPH_WIGBR|nr:RecName: Full=4-hydroxy-3-methylbut-2-enyl diphosphate reductase; Short=HMBPP reductase [Wigglesworthia glossinidia endosymbiont of Glossina brevipalpis]BAC24438.1 lytB [Wigglesworthia glossinidia endosymbiont of Glossina brevipalpis]